MDSASGLNANQTVKEVTAVTVHHTLEGSDRERRGGGVKSRQEGGETAAKSRFSWGAGAGGGGQQLEWGEDSSGKISLR